jgi:hypothetical protein
MKQHNYEKIRYILAETSILGIGIILRGQPESKSKGFINIPLCAQVSSHQTDDVQTLGSSDETLYANQHGSAIRYVLVRTFGHIEHRLEHEEHAAYYGHVVKVELWRVPSWWWYIVSPVPALPSAVLNWYWSYGIEFGIFERLLRGCRRRYDEACIEGVERIQLTNELERHDDSNAISSCSRRLKPLARYGCNVAGSRRGDRCGEGGELRNLNFWSSRLATASLQHQRQPRDTSSINTPQPTNSRVNLLIRPRRKLHEGLRIAIAAHDEHAQLLDRTSSGRVCRR